MKPLGFFRTIVDNVERWANLLGSWLTIFLMCVVASEVIYRASIGKSIIGVVEQAELVMVGIAALTLSYTQKTGGHVRVDFVLIRLPDKIVHIIESSVLLICFLFSVIVLVWSSKMAWDSVAIMEVAEAVSRVPVWPWKITIPIGFLMLSVRFFIQAMEEARMIFAKQISISSKK